MRTLPVSATYIIVPSNAMSSRLGWQPSSRMHDDGRILLAMPKTHAGGPAKKKRCAWPGTDPLYVAYHDEEWGVPVHDDRQLFEFLVLEGAQAGLS